MKVYYDLHIHTALSPCGNDDMTPNNIVNMAKIKELDVIAITDHNSCENTEACIYVGNKIGITVIPGMELQTKEDIHVVCLFKDLNRGLEFQDYVYKKLPRIKNKEDIFGTQLVLDSNDEIKKINSRFLLASADISFDEASYIVKYLSGAFIPAHIDRESFSVISSLGFIPDALPIRTLECPLPIKIESLIKKGLLHKNYRLISSSDAHDLGMIMERGNCLEVMENSAESIIDKLNS